MFNESTYNLGNRRHMKHGLPQFWSNRQELLDPFDADLRIQDPCRPTMCFKEGRRLDSYRALFLIAGTSEIRASAAGKHQGIANGHEKAICRPVSEAHLGSIA